MNCKNSGVNVTKSVAVLTNIEISGPKLIHRSGEDMNDRQLSKFLSGSQPQAEIYAKS